MVMLDSQGYDVISVCTFVIFSPLDVVSCQHVPQFWFTVILYLWPT